MQHKIELYYSELDVSFQFLLFSATLGIFRVIIKCMANEVCMNSYLI